MGIIQSQYLEYLVWKDISKPNKGVPWIRGIPRVDFTLNWIWYSDILPIQGEPFIWLADCLVFENFTFKIISNDRYHVLENNVMPKQGAPRFGRQKPVENIPKLSIPVAFVSCVTNSLLHTWSILSDHFFLLVCIRRSIHYWYQWLLVNPSCKVVLKIKISFPKCGLQDDIWRWEPLRIPRKTKRKEKVEMMNHYIFVHFYFENVETTKQLDWSEWASELVSQVLPLSRIVV